MIDLTRRTLLGSTVALTACNIAGVAQAPSNGFQCPPCGCSMDHVIFDNPGKCPDCGMVLRPMSDPYLGQAPASLPEGTGRFELTGATGKPFAIHYLKPFNFDRHSPIVLVIPGAGRNSEEYRNAWLETATAQGALIAALGYPEEQYDFAAYHLCGLVKNLSFRDPKVEQISRRARTISIDDRDISYELNNDPQSWLFNDFDFAFDHIAKVVGTARTSYAIFGHSAGGQILHRMALFQSSSKAETIIAANSGFYTLPLFDQPLPTGLKETGIDQGDLVNAFSKPLTVLLGEDDNNAAAGGTLLKTPLVRLQGEGRFQRGSHFFSNAEEAARTMNTRFNWQMQTVPDVGHDFEAMSAAAATLVF